MFKASTLIVLLLLPAVGADDGLLLDWQQLPSLPGTPGLASPFGGMSHNVLLVAGGANFPHAPPWKKGVKVWQDAVYALADGEWTIIGRLAAPCAYGVSFQLEDSVVCAGGGDAERHHNEVVRMTWSSRGPLFEKLPPLPLSIANACGAVSGNTLFLACGTESPTSTSALSTFYVLDLAAVPLAWKKLPDVPGTGRLLPVAAATPTHFYVFSGAALSFSPDGKPVRKYLKDAWRFDVVHGQWSRLSDLPFAAVAAPSPAPVIDSGEIVIPGGDDGSLAGFQPPEDHPGFPRRSLIYSPAHNRWHVQADLQISRVTVPVIKTEDGFILASGEERPGVRSPEVWKLKLNTAAKPQN